MKKIHDFSATDIDGVERNLSEFAGKVVMVVNVASKCGFAPQYKGLEAMYQKYRDRGFVVLGFPTNDFLRQEPGTDAEIKSFCSLTYGVSFPMFSKITVKGKDTHPLFAWLTDKKENPQFGGKVTWNFNKFLFDRTGMLIARFDSKDEPLGDKIPRVVVDALGR